MDLAPIALFTYRRLRHTTKTVAALQGNLLAHHSDLYIFSDGPRDERARADVAAVREFLRTVGGFRSVTVTLRDRNLGLANSIIAGVTELASRFGRVIVVEDDLVSSMHFLTYMNEGLSRYRDEERAISIHAYSYPVDEPLPKTFFLRGADCWGWATWKRGWDLFEPDGGKLYDELKERRLLGAFDFDNAFAYSQMLQDQVHGRNDSWAVRWYASAFLKDRLTLYPGRSLVRNIGLDGSGTHCGDSDRYDDDLAVGPVEIAPIAVVEHAGARAAFARFMRRSRPSMLQRIQRRLGWPKVRR
jgi:hypothetical protein